MSDPLLQYADVASGLAEIEAAELRLELCAMHEHAIRVMLCTWRFHVTQETLYDRLLRFSQVRAYEVSEFKRCNAEDGETLKGFIASFRERWGRAPLERDGTVIEAVPAPRRSKTPMTDAILAALRDKAEQKPKG